MKLVDGIDMEKVKAAEVKEMITAFNKAKLGTQIKAGANPLGSAKAFVKAVEALDESKLGDLPQEVQEYYNLIVVSDDELDKQSEEEAVVEEEEAPAPAAEEEEEEEEEQKPDTARKSSKKPAKAEKKSAQKQDTSKKGKSSITDSMTIHIVEGKEPKKPGTAVFELFKMFKKYKTVAAFIKAGGQKKELSFYRYHGKIELK